MPDTAHRNEILVVGRVTSTATKRELPSGDVILTVRVTVDRDGEDGYDVVNCTAWTARMQKTVGSWARGDVVEVVGALRSRYWRGPTGALGSASDVEVQRARRLAAAITRPRKPE
jgi:single-strand DNA-binding protein